MAEEKLQSSAPVRGDFHLKTGNLTIGHWSESPCQLLRLSLSARVAHGLLNTSVNHPRSSLLPQQAKATRRARDSNRSVPDRGGPSEHPTARQDGARFHQAIRPPVLEEGDADPYGESSNLSQLLLPGF